MRNLLQIVNKLRVGSSVGQLATKHRAISCSAVRPNMQERKMKVDGSEVNYVRVGSGEPVLLLPGALGSIWTDFRPQIENLDRQKFTVIAWDPPGYGKSRPPGRTFPDDFFHRDAACAANLMRSLGYEKYSLIGWSDGGITALIMAGTYTENIRGLVAVAANAYITPTDKQIYTTYRSIDSWSEKMRKPYVEVYGDEYFRRCWSDWVDAVLRIDEKQKGNICMELLPRIKCPTLIVHGTKDAMVPGEHPIYLKDHIAGAKLRVFEKGAHNLHLRYPEEFNALVTEFLTEPAKL